LPANVIVGMNSVAQVNEICDYADAVLPDPDTVAAVRALSVTDR